jgi:hypothetical protein
MSEGAQPPQLPPQPPPQVPPPDGGDPAASDGKQDPGQQQLGPLPPNWQDPGQPDGGQPQSMVEFHSRMEAQEQEQLEKFWGRVADGWDSLTSPITDYFFLHSVRKSTKK